jgi:TetR/AcrR family transcriptional regulator, lmrAB and yxaGH operons repressor
MAARLKAVQAPTRKRILDAARHLIQRHGYYGANTADMLHLAAAPKGSMYHHFPAGKEQIAVEAIRLIRAELKQLMHSPAMQSLSVADALRRLAKSLGGWLKASHWQEGSLLASTVVGSVPDSPKLHAEIKAGFDEWREFFTKRLVEQGRSIRDARLLSQTIIASMEGSLILARVDADERTVTDVLEQIASWLER